MPDLRRLSSSDKNNIERTYIELKLTGAEILMECLLEQEVDTVFGYPGGTILYVYDALVKYRDRVHHYLTAHEQGAWCDQPDYRSRYSVHGFIPGSIYFVQCC